MDNERFNITGDDQGQLHAVLELIFRREFKWPRPHQKAQEGYGGFTGYRLDPFLGLVLYQYPLNDDSVTLRFPFKEGHDPQMLATFVYNYLKSDAAKTVKDPPMPTTEKGYDDFESLRDDFRWDGSCDHDGSNGEGWRVYTGRWGHLPMHGHSAPFAIRPIVAWYGK